MKRLLIVIATTLLLGACASNKVHENISERMADDTYQVLEILDVAVKDEGKVSDKEQKVLDAYMKTYGDKVENNLLTEEETKLYDSMDTFIFIKDTYTDLKSDRKQYEIGRQNIVNIIETGEGY